MGGRQPVAVSPKQPRMNNGAQVGRTAAGLHLNHGPIDLIVRAQGAPDTVAAAYDRATQCFAEILPDLARELGDLRTPVERIRPPTGAVSRSMYSACLPYAKERVTPMAAVAGAVADYVLAAMVASLDLQRAWVNNGGDIAFMLATGQQFACGMKSGPAGHNDLGRLVVRAEDGIRGVASSGWATKDQGGRSFSLGIADSVTVLARTTAEADVAATLIANRVDLPSNTNIRRVTAMELDPDSDLGRRRVTQGVPNLGLVEKRAALQRGADFAYRCRDQGLIRCALLFLQGEYQLVGAANWLQHAA